MARFTLSRKMRRARLWLLSAVVIGLLPVLWEVLHDAILGSQQDWSAAFSSGDALVLSAALAGGCVYDLLIRRVRRDDEDTVDTEAVLIMLALILAVGAALWFGEMRDNPQDAPHTALWTVAYLGLTIVVCLRSLYLTYDAEGTVTPPPAPRPARQNGRQSDENQFAGQSEGGGRSA
jgi:drug/metabolite transporter (DMT)-like permease